MLYLYHSNKMERLLQALLEVLEQPLANPFAAETMLVQNYGMAHWITQRTAAHRGIAANLDFPLPASFIWRIFDLILKELMHCFLFWKSCSCLINNCLLRNFCTI